MSHYQILTLNQISSHGLHRFPVGALRGRQGDRRAGRDPRALARHARDGDSRPASRRSAAPARAPTTFRSPRCRSAACRCSTRRAPTPMRSRSWCWPRCCWRRATWSRRCATSTRSTPRRADLEARVEEGKKQFAGVELPQPHARHHRPGRDRQPGRRHRDQARHEGHRLRPRDHRRCRLAAAVERAQGATASRRC